MRAGRTSLTIVLLSAACLLGCTGGSSAKNPLPSDVHVAVKRLQSADEIFVEPYRVTNKRWRMSADEAAAVKALVAQRNYKMFEQGPSVAICYWLVVGDDRWGILLNGLFYYGSSRDHRFAHPKLNFNSPQPRDREGNSEHIQQALQDLVQLHRSGELD